MVDKMYRNNKFSEFNTNIVSRLKTGASSPLHFQLSKHFRKYESFLLDQIMSRYISTTLQNVAKPCFTIVTKAVYKHIYIFNCTQVAPKICRQIYIEKYFPCNCIHDTKFVSNKKSFNLVYLEQVSVI